MSRIDLISWYALKISASSRPEALDDVLVGVRVDRFLERLAQQVLPALGRRDVAIGAEHDVVGGERIGGDEEAEVALDDEALVVGQAVRVLPQLDVALHVHFLRHPVVGAGGEVLVPRPAVLERDELVDVGRAVDDALVLHADAAEAVLHGLLFDVELVRRARASGLADVMACARMPGERARPASADGGGRRGGSGVANSSSKLSMFHPLLLLHLTAATARIVQCIALSLSYR